MQIDNNTNEQQYDYQQYSPQYQGQPQDQYNQQYAPQYAPQYQGEPQYQQQEFRDGSGISAEQIEDFINKYEEMQSELERVQKNYKNAEKLIGKRVESLSDEDRRALSEMYYGSRGMQNGSIPDDYKITDSYIINNVASRVYEPEIQDQHLSTIVEAAKALGVSEDKIKNVDEYTWGIYDGIHEGLEKQAAVHNEELMARTDEAYGGEQYANDERMRAVNAIPILAELANSYLDLGYEITSEDIFENFMEAHGIAEHPLMVLLLSELDKKYNSRSFSRVYAGAAQSYGTESYGRSPEEVQAILSNKHHPDYMKVLQERVNERLRRR